MTALDDHTDGRRPSADDLLGILSFPEGTTAKQLRDEGRVGHTPPLSSDPHIAAVQNRILTLAEKRVIPPADRLVLLRNALGNLHRMAHLSIADRQLAQLVLESVEAVSEELAAIRLVVEQMVGLPS